MPATPFHIIQRIQRLCNTLRESRCLCEQLAPVAATETPTVVVPFPARLDPHRMRARGAIPTSGGPGPAAASQIPESVDPDITGSRGISDSTVRGRRGWGRDIGVNPWAETRS